MRAGDSAGTSEPLGLDRRGAFAGRPMTIGWAAMILFALYACTHMVAAGDTWVAMACGRHFANHGVDTVEPFSANSHDAGPTPEEVATWPGWAQWITDAVGLDTVRAWHPTGWINQNWLTHLLFYRLSTGLGSEEEPFYNALVLWKFAVYILAAVALYFTSRLYGVDRGLAVVFVCFGLYIGRSFFDVRPAAFSNLLAAVLLLILALASYRSALYIWLLVPLVVFWSNLHGGYIYVFLVLIPFIAWHAILRLPHRWTITAYSVLLWLVLYGLANRVSHLDFMTPIGVRSDWLFYVLLLAIGGAIALAWLRTTSDKGILVYHVAVSCVLFLLLLTRFFPALPSRLSGRAEDALVTSIAGARLAYLGIFSFAMILGAVVVGLRDKAVRVMPTAGILHSIGAYVAAFIAMVIFNPFHLTNVTHTFVISVSEHAERWRDVHEWHRAFDWTNPVGTPYPFLYLYILGWLLLIAWAILWLGVFRKPAPQPKKLARKPIEYPWQRVDLSMLIIAAMTVYMAIRSRRFIPIAGFVACPVLALLADRIVQTVAALNFRRLLYPALLFVESGLLFLAVWTAAGNVRPPWGGRYSVIAIIAAVVLGIFLVERFVRMALKADGGREGGPLKVPAMSEQFQGISIGVGAVAVLALGLAWGARFHRVYLDFWPADPRLSSVFMRMTASDAKPFYACEFIRINELRGKMFNYWTEGGFIAWGQDPDPETGRTPLRLFMDGRAQAAYDVRVFDRWTDIMSGGPLVARSYATGGSLSGDEYRQVGKWVSEQLRDHDVWVVLMPSNQFRKPFTLGLEYSGDWQTVFLNNKQKLFVDIGSPQGLALYQGVFSGETKYPDDFTAKLSLGHNLLLLQEVAQKQRGLELIIEAFNLYPSAAPMMEMLLIGSRYAALQPRIDAVCAEYAAEFEENRAEYARQDGYNLRLEAARLALIRLEQVATAEGDRERAEVYRKRRALYEGEQAVVLYSKRW